MIYQFLALLFVHWIADFVLQTDWQAKNKSSDNVALGKHVATYTICLGLAVPIIFHPANPVACLAFIALNGVMHFATDYYTSRLNSWLWAKGDVHNFFVAVGFDQLIHQFTLALTAIWLLGR